MKSNYISIISRWRQCQSSSVSVYLMPSKQFAFDETQCPLAFHVKHFTVFFYRENSSVDAEHSSHIGQMNKWLWPLHKSIFISFIIVISRKSRWNYVHNFPVGRWKSSSHQSQLVHLNFQFKNSWPWQRSGTDVRTNGLCECVCVNVEIVDVCVCAYMCFCDSIGYTYAVTSFFIFSMPRTSILYICLRK